MKKTITLTVAAFTAFAAFAQLPVSTVAGKKQVLLEEFTGNTCGYCPDGHLRSDQLTAANPGKAFAVNVHTGSYATPSSASNSLDFRTTEGSYVISIPNMVGDQSNPCFGFPAGAINRRPPTVTGPSIPMCPGGYGMSRGGWAANAAPVLQENAYINIAGQAYLHPNTRQMIVNMEAYYTAAPPAGKTNNMTVDLLQDNIIAYQSGASLYPAMVVGNGYRHNHALRDVINSGANLGVSGDPITGATTPGTKWSKTYTYTVDATYPSSGAKVIPAVLADLNIVAFITEGFSNVIAVCKVPITITTSTDIFGDNNITPEAISLVNVYPTPMVGVGTLVYTLNESMPVAISITNTLGQVVLTENLGTQIGEQKYEINAANLADGVYSINIQAGDRVVSKKITVLNK